MLIVKLWHYIRGYVIINIKGRHLERLINLVHHNNILIWDIIKVNSQEIRAKIEIDDFAKVNRLAEELSCNVEIIKRSGMTLWKWKVKNRKIFAAALLLVLLIVYIMSLMVFTVDIVGDLTGEEDLLKDLESLGLKPWTLKSKLDVEQVKASFLKQHSEIEYINIEFDGTKAIVEIVEVEKKQDIYDKSVPVNLVASRDGVISDMLIINGTANVEVGQEVKKGDLLVKGVITSKKQDGDKEETVVKYVHAMAKVVAETVYQQEYKVRKYKVIDEDDYKIDRVLYIGDLVINLMDGDENYYYDSSEEKVLKVLGKELPIKVDKIRYYPKDNCEEKTEEEIIDEVYEKAKDDFIELGQLKNVEIISSSEANNVITFKSSVTVLEDIAEEQKINGEE